MSVAAMAFSLFAVNEGYLDDVDIKKVVPFEQSMQAHLRSSHGKLLDEINKNPDYNDEVVAKMKAAMDDFVKNGSW